MEAERSPRGSLVEVQETVWFSVNKSFVGFPEPGPGAACR